MVSAHGALIYLNLPVTLDPVMVVKNPEAAEEQACRVAFRNIDADGKTEVGLDSFSPLPISGAFPSHPPVGPSSS